MRLIFKLFHLFTNIEIFFLKSKAGRKGSPPRNGKRGLTDVLALKAGKHPAILLCDT